jgi:transposase-like protein
MQLRAKSIHQNEQTSPVPLTASKPERPDPEVPEKKPRRRFTAQYKLRILAEVDACTTPGEIGAILRREGLYYSNIGKWRQQRHNGALKELSPQKRGRKKHEISHQDKRIAELERENSTLTKKLKQAEAIIEIQKKISEIFGTPPTDSDEKKP